MTHVLLHCGHLLLVGVCHKTHKNVNMSSPAVEIAGDADSRQAAIGQSNMLVTLTLAYLPFHMTPTSLLPHEVIKFKVRT